MTVMLDLKLPDWMTVIGTVLAFATFGWTVWKEVSQRLAEQRSRITLTTEDTSGGHVLSVRFAGAEPHTSYEAQLRLLRPRGALFSYGRLVAREARGIVFSGGQMVPAELIGRRARLTLSQQRSDPPTCVSNEIVLVGTTSQSRAAVRIIVLDLAGPKVVARRTLGLHLL